MARFSPGARQRLLAWFDDRARDVPWRHDRTPYRVWISEIMLQQTRVATAVSYFERWMARYPDVRTVARADPDDVLRAWEGLGYYRRARALHRAAREIAIVRGGRFPADEEGWRELPGVGAYTAAAIAALAHDRRTVAVDGNVRRLGARLLALPRPKDEELRRALLPLVPEDRPGRGVEALIELGATVCTPRAPDCRACPLAACCLGRREGVARFPEPRSRRPVPTRTRYARIHVKDDRLWLRRRDGEGLLGGMWGPPQDDEPPDGDALAPVRHVYSHFRLELVPVLVSEPPPARATEPPDADSDGRWVRFDDLDELPLSAVDRAVVARSRDALREADGS